MKITPLLVLTLGAAACTTDNNDLETFSETNPLYYVTSKIWNQRDIPVCWLTSGNATEKAWVREALRGQRSWTQTGNLNFVGWGTCAAGAGGIRLQAGSSMATSYLSLPAGSAATITLDFGASVHTTYTRCLDNSLTREECIKTVAIHEFGHAIGYAHEHNRPDTPASCTSLPQGTDGNATFGNWDGLSIMAYCDFTTNMSGTDRTGTERLYGARNGDSPRLADYDGDGKDDLFCFDVLNGSMWQDLASATGTFTGTNWSRASHWCDSTETRRLHTGDFNGDGRGDLLCFDVASGEEFIDYASATGTFTAQDFSYSGGWCNGLDTRQLLIGDFNGDGRDDLFCFETTTGDEYIDYASATGAFAGTDWSRAASWCDAGANRRIFVGDFNGDGRDDLYCHDIGNGDQFIDYASATGTFLGSDWTRSASWCNSAGVELRIADFNGDTRDDLLCYNAISGSYAIDYASATGTFAGTDFSMSTGWCNGNGATLFTGDVNGDNRDDLVCHNVGTGSKWVDYASATGAFAVTDWSIAGGWCGHDAGEVH